MHRTKDGRHLAVGIRVGRRPPVGIPVRGASNPGPAADSQGRVAGRPGPEADNRPDWIRPAGIHRPALRTDPAPGSRPAPGRDSRGLVPGIPPVPDLDGRTVRAARAVDIHPAATNRAGKEADSLRVGAESLSPPEEAAAHSVLAFNRALRPNGSRSVRHRDSGHALDHQSVTCRTQPAVVPVRGADRRR